MLYNQGNSRVAAELINIDQTQINRDQGVQVRSILSTSPDAALEEWRFRFQQPFLQKWQHLFIEVTFLDKGAGVIQPKLLSNDAFSGTWAEPVRAVSFTRLNTGKIRSALFEFVPAAVDWQASAHVHLKIAGLQHLVEVRALAQVTPASWNALRDRVPVEVQPMVKLERAMQINCTVGIADVGNPPPLEKSLDNVREYAPLAKVLGFTSIECFVRWDMIEPQPGVFDFSHYDRLVAAIQRYKLKWFPNLVITSAFALPSWFFESNEYTPFRCVEHDQINQSPSIWNEHNRKHVVRVLHAFGAHYKPMGVLEAVRLGPSGNFGEAQYPAGAGGALGYQRKRMHAHIGWWAGDSCARSDFQRYLKERYTTIERLNGAWEEQYSAFAQIAPQLPEHYRTRQGRLDMTDWYTSSMSKWCGFWARIAREAMPDIPIYQSAGGWGYREAGTDFSALSESMREVQGGIRLTNETDSFEQNFYATRMAATAARLYGIMLGYEPAGFHSSHGVAARFMTCMATNADNLYTRHQVLFTRPDAVTNWLRDYPLLDLRTNPLVDVAIYYPETMSQLDDGAFRYLYGWGFNPRAAEIRRRIDADFLDERLIRAGFLDRYKVLVFCWGNIINADVQQIIDRWIRNGGVAIYPARNNQETVEGDFKLFTAWENGDTGKGTFYRFQGVMEPISFYGDFVETALRKTPHLHRWTHAVLNIQKPPRVYTSLLENGTLLALNYNEEPVSMVLPNSEQVILQPFTVWHRLLP